MKKLGDIRKKERYNYEEKITGQKENEIVTFRGGQTGSAHVHAQSSCVSTFTCSHFPVWFGL